MIISNNNTFQYNNIEPFNKLIGGTNNSQKISNPDKHETDLVKIYLKIYIRLFLYIQFKLNKKFNNSIKSKTNVMKQETLINAKKNIRKIWICKDIYNLLIYSLLDLYLNLCVKIILMIYVSNILIVF